MGVRRGLAALGVVLAASLIVPAAAHGDRGALAEGKRLFRQVEYRRAITALRRALAGNLTRSERIEATLLLAKAHHALDRPGDALAAFRRLLRLAPGFQLSPTREPPSLLAIFARARGSIRAPRLAKKATISHRPVRQALAGRPLRIVAQVHHLAPEDRVRVYYRRIGQLRYEARVLASSGGDVFAGVIDLEEPTGISQAYLLEYYLAVSGALGETLAQVGSRERPLQIRVSISTATATSSTSTVGRPAPWYKRYWWIWVAVGAVVVGGAVGGALAAR